MLIEIFIQVDSEQLILKIQQLDFERKIPNIVGYDLTSRKLIAIGETPEEIQRQMPDKWEKSKSTIGFAPMFDAYSFDAQFSSAALEFYVLKARMEIHPTLWFVSEVFDSVDCHLNFPMYERLLSETREAFEYSVQESAKLNNFVVNGQFVGWPKWQRTFATWSFQLLNLMAVGGLCYGLLSVVRFITNPVMAEQNILLDLVFAVAILVVVAFSFQLLPLLIAIVWAVVVGRILPKNLLRLMLFNSYPKNQTLRKMLASVAKVFLYEPATSSV